MKKSGYNTNLASEFHGLLVLYRFGMDARLTLGNKKSVDIVVTRDIGDSITIDVKAVAGAVDWLVGNPGGEPKARHFVVLVSYEGKFTDVEVSPSAWILPHAEFLNLVKTARAPSVMRFISRKAVKALTEGRLEFAGQPNVTAKSAIDLHIAKAFGRVYGSD